MTNKRMGNGEGKGSTGNGKNKSKYRDLSTAAAKSAAFGRDDVCWLDEGEQATAGAEGGQAKATADPSTRLRLRSG
jgi:hypothetical protein